jgi:hypothetical protein
MPTLPAILAPFLFVALVATVGLRAEEVQVVARQEGWSAYLHEVAGKRTCFAAAQPKSSEPATAKRDAIYFYVTSWPRDGITGEVSVKVGYPLKKGSTVTVAIGADAFKLVVKDDRAFVSDSGEEKRLVGAMRKGGTMTVSGVSERGTQTKDTYPLAGVVEALDSLKPRCS